MKFLLGLKEANPTKTHKPDKQVREMGGGARRERGEGRKAKREGGREKEGEGR